MSAIRSHSARYPEEWLADRVVAVYLGAVGIGIEAQPEVAPRR